jgi:DNA invertase Pin-like site-specific DNA recombinase
MKAIYIRISTANQKTERQMRNTENEKHFIDVCSGTIPFNERPNAQKLINDKTITEIQVEDIDRLGRNGLDVLNTIQHFTANNVNIHIERYGLDTLIDGKTNPLTDFLVGILSSLSQMQRNTILENTRQGVAIAKAKGKYKGRKRGATSPVEKYEQKYAKQILVASDMIKAGKSINQIVKDLNELGTETAINRATLTKLKELGLLKSVL